LIEDHFVAVAAPGVDAFWKQRKACRDGEASAEIFAERIVETAFHRKSL
jgi:hypothetical protein